MALEYYGGQFNSKSIHKRHKNEKHGALRPCKNTLQSERRRKKTSIRCSAPAGNVCVGNLGSWAMDMSAKAAAASRRPPDWPLVVCEVREVGDRCAKFSSATINWVTDKSSDQASLQIWTTWKITVLSIRLFIFIFILLEFYNSNVYGLNIIPPKYLFQTFQWF